MREFKVRDNMNGFGHDGQDYFYTVSMENSVHLYRLDNSKFGEIKFTIKGDSSWCWVYSWQQDDNCCILKINNHYLTYKSKQYRIKKSSITEGKFDQPEKVLYLSHDTSFYAWKNIVAVNTTMINREEKLLISTFCPHLASRFFDEKILVFDSFSYKILLEIETDCSQRYLWIAPDLMTMAVVTKKKVLVFDLV